MRLTEHEIFGVLMIALLGVYLGLTIMRNHTWADSLRLWEDTVSKSPNKVRPWVNAGTQAMQRNQRVKAKLYYETALKAGTGTLKDKNFKGDAKTNLAIMAIEDGRLDEAAKLLADVIQNTPNLEALNAFAYLAVVLGHPQDALHVTSNILKLDDSWKIRPSLWGTRGDAFKALGMCTEARQSYEAVQYLVPSYQIPNCP